MAAGGLPSLGFLVAAAAGILLVFALWWSYFEHTVARQIRQSLPWTFVWALAHYPVFAAVAAVGAGMQVVVDTLGTTPTVSAVFAAFTVAVPVAVFLIVLGLVNARMSDQPVITGLVLLTAVLVIAAAAATRIATRPHHRDHDGPGSPSACLPSRRRTPNHSTTRAAPTQVTRFATRVSLDPCGRPNSVRVLTLTSRRRRE